MSMFDEALREFNLRKELEDWRRENPGRELSPEMEAKSIELSKLESLFYDPELDPDYD